MQATFHYPRDRNMRVRRVDIVASLLASCLVVCGLVVLLLAAIWLVGQTTTPELARPLIAHSGGGNLTEALEKNEIALPAESVLEPMDFPDELTAISSTAITFAEQFNDEASRGGGKGLHSDRRGPGQNNDEQAILTEDSSRFERWEVIFQAADISDYARQLDHFGIELGCIGGGVPDVDYATALSSETMIRSGPSSAERRLYFVWRDQNALADYDRQLLRNAGIKTQGRLTIRFISKVLEQELAALEMEYARASGHETIDEIKRTVFRSGQSSDGYRFEVVRQTYTKAE